jgi:hypothetical protein
MFRHKYPHSCDPASSSILELVKKKASTECLLDNKYTRRNAVFNQETFHVTQTRVEYSPRKSQARLVQQAQV